MTIPDITAHEPGENAAPPNATTGMNNEPQTQPANNPVRLDLSRWIGMVVDDGLTTAQALAELRNRPCEKEQP